MKIGRPGHRAPCTVHRLSADRLIETSAGLLAAATICAAVIRVTIRDRFVPFSTIYYATPLPLLAMLAALAAVLCWRNWRRLAIACAAIGAASLTGWLLFGFSRHKPMEEGNLSVVFWNAARPTPFVTGAAGVIAGHRADIIGLSEARSASHRAQRIWRNACPGCDSRFLSHGTAMMARGRILSVRTRPLHGWGSASRLEIEIDGKEIVVILVDLDPGPLRSRRGDFIELEWMARAERGRPLIMMGDFNTPLDSVHFERLRNLGMQHAFATRGRGMAATWPVPIPVLALDHLWVGGGIRVHSCRLESYRLSDHRLLRARLSF